MPRPAIHPGEILSEELQGLGVKPAELARAIGVPANRISQILSGRRAISGDTALRLGHWFKTGPQFWMNLQSSFELRQAELESGKAVSKLPTRDASTSRA